ncbi:P2Y purinoceptor 13-like [Scomber scombrus]|uniref:P2Y purinoceptor 13-like n=1 Tax=Scomber scombrus TaxID=13677 RepID=UPI002DDABE26|nr:P2Y purinoceptor 13-like [Scomber scombrus]
MDVTSSSNQSQVNGQCEHIDESGHLFFALAYSLVSVVGVVLNSLTLKVYFCSAQQQVSSIMMVYMRNLAACDFLLCLYLPLRIINYISSSVTFQLVYCNFAVLGLYLNMYASILFMGYIAANRYLKIIYPLGNHFLRTVQAARIISTVTWIFLLAPVISYVTLSLLTQEPLTAVPNRCESLHNAQVHVFYKIIHVYSTVTFLVVLVSLVFFYHSASRSVLQAQQRQLASSSCKKLRRSRMKILVLVSVFCVCFVPYHLVRLPYVFLQRQCSLSKVFYYLKELTVLLSVLNVCLDPFIYFMFCKAFRSQLTIHITKRRNEGQPRATNTFRVPLTGTKGPGPSPEEQPHTIIPPPPNFTLVTMQSDKYRCPSNHQTQALPSDRQKVKHDSSLQRTRLPSALHLVMFGLDAAARPWKPIP